MNVGGGQRSRFLGAHKQSWEEGKGKKKYREKNYALGFYDIDDSGEEMLEKTAEGI